MSVDGWIGVDLDGTLAVYDGWRGSDHIGEPIVPMVKRVLAWLAAGTEVRLVTARLGDSDDDDRSFVTAWIAWSLREFGTVLPVTRCKDFGMLELWDDRAVQVEVNTGRRLGSEPSGPVTP